MRTHGKVLTVLFAITYAISLLGFFVYPAMAKGEKRADKAPNTMPAGYMNAALQRARNMGQLKPKKGKGSPKAQANAKWSRNPNDERGQGNMGKPDMRDPYGFDKYSNREKGERGRVVHEINTDDPITDPLDDPVTDPLVYYIITDQLRITASGVNWIGLYELVAYDIEGNNVALGKEVTYFGDKIPSWWSYREPSGVTDGKDHIYSSLHPYDFNTFAYPCDLSFNYTINLGGYYPIDNIVLDWGYFGENTYHTYITNWFLEAYIDNVWQQIASGGEPLEAMTEVKIVDGM